MRGPSSAVERSGNKPAGIYRAPTLQTIIRFHRRCSKLNWPRNIFCSCAISSPCLVVSFELRPLASIRTPFSPIFLHFLPDHPTLSFHRPFYSLSSSTETRRLFFPPLLSLHSNCPIALREVKRRPKGRNGLEVYDPAATKNAEAVRIFRGDVYRANSGHLFWVNFKGERNHSEEKGEEVSGKRRGHAGRWDRKICGGEVVILFIQRIAFSEKRGGPSNSP